MSKLVGGILQAAGILIAGASGLCSLFFVGSIVRSVFTVPQREASLGFLVFVIPIGGLPFAIGFALFRWGRAIVRRAEDSPERDFE